jgi:SAM-dependent methyltransferase
MNKTQALITPVVSYELVAQEYYDPERHPTCANFREASRLLFRPWLSLVPNRKLICEVAVGAGKSLLAEILSEALRSLNTLTLLDEAPSMLSYSRALKEVGVRLDLASVFALPYGSESFDVVASCLGDPYNSISFWTEVRRVLKPDGICLFTTPSWEWAKAFREITDTNSMHNSAFELSDGSQISLPSHIYPQHDQIRLIESANLAVSEISQVLIRDMSGQRLSPKLVLQRGADASVITGYVATRLDKNT